ncbi:MAG: ABC transporter permease, partial [Bacteroidota bacterium]
MFSSIIKFELQYRMKRPATYIYFFILALFSFAALAMEELTVGGGTGQIKENAPTQLALMMGILSILPGFFINSAIMGVPIVRDREHKTESMLYTTSLNKTQYLFGRFIGSFLVLVFVFSGLLFGLMLGGLVVSGKEDYLAFDAWHYIQPWLLLVLSNIFIGAALFFAGGALTRKLVFVFMQGAILLVLYLIGGSMGSDLDQKTFVALSDPFALNTMDVISQYWTISEKNSQLFGLNGLMLMNRLIWVGVAFLSLGLTWAVFKFQVVRTSKRSKKAAAVETQPKSVLGSLQLPPATITDGFRTNWLRIQHFTRLYLSEVVKSVPFIAILAIAMLMMAVNGAYFNNLYGTEVYPQTGLLLDQLLNDFYIFLIIIVVFYSGELVWKERDIRFHQIYDATAVPNWVSLTSKYLAMAGVFVLLLLSFILMGVLIQTFKGYFDYQIGLYFRFLFTETFLWLLLYTGFAFFIQVMVNNKFMGHAFMIVFYIINFFALSQLGLEHNMFRFGSGQLGTFSDMNNFGPFVQPFNWFQIYWIGFTMLLFVVSILFATRGTNAIGKTRLKLAGLRVNQKMIGFGMLALLLFAGSGCFVYYNTNVLNEYRNSDQSEELQANYEKTLKKYEDLPQPKIVETNLAVDIYPEKRDFTGKGFYILKNKTSQAIPDLHIQTHNRNNLRVEDLKLSVPAKIKETYEEFNYLIYELETPLAPGDSLRMDFTTIFETKGFKEGGTNTDIVFNGTFFNSTYFPGLGYEESNELGSKKTRKEYDLPEKERQRPRTDTVMHKVNLLGDDADRIRFEIVLSTAPNQIAIAPGYLQREWEENDRRYFHYKMDKPILNFFSIVSADYEVMEEEWNGIKLQIFYHRGHDYNLERMMRGMKKSLGYFSKNFSPYQYRQMRIMEFPRYASFAQSFANTVPFSEAIGFVQEIGEDAIDMPFYVTSHEVAHQWWAHQVTEANARGNAMMSETMSQYSALMVMKQEYPEEMIQQFLEYELDRYLSGRAGETRKEMPLEHVEGQGYIHYRKGSLVMYALQDYVGEDSV